jgi:hypothetical protein
MRTLFWFVLTSAGIVALADDASAFGRRGRWADTCGYGDVGVASDGSSVAYTTGYTGQTGSVYVSPGPSSTSYRYYPNGGIWPTVYNPTVYPGNGVIPAPGLIDTKPVVPITPRPVANPKPDKDK